MRYDRYVEGARSELLHELLNYSIELGEKSAGRVGTPPLTFNWLEKEVNPSALIRTNLDSLLQLTAEAVDGLAEYQYERPITFHGCDRPKALRLQAADACENLWLPAGAMLHRDHVLKQLSIELYAESRNRRAIHFSFAMNDELKPAFG